MCMCVYLYYVCIYYVYLHFLIHHNMTYVFTHTTYTLYMLYTQAHHTHIGATTPICSHLSHTFVHRHGQHTNSLIRVLTTVPNIKKIKLIYALCKNFNITQVRRVEAKLCFHSLGDL